MLEGDRYIQHFARVDLRGTVTFSNNTFFGKLDGQKALHKVLHAYSVYDPKVRKAGSSSLKLHALSLFVLYGSDY